MEQGASTAIAEIQNLLKEFFGIAGEKGATIQGNVLEFIKHTAANIEALIKTAGSNVMAEAHALKLDQLGALAKRMHDQVEHNEALSSFWEDMVKEIPDFIEWTENVLKEGEEVIAGAAETVGEVATNIAEVGGEVAAEVADVGGEVVEEAAVLGSEIAPEVSEVVASMATDV